MRLEQAALLASPVGFNASVSVLPALTVAASLSPAGAHVLSRRWDCEHASQVWPSSGFEPFAATTRYGPRQPPTARRSWRSERLSLTAYQL